MSELETMLTLIEVERFLEDCGLEAFGHSAHRDLRAIESQGEETIEPDLAHIYFGKIGMCAMVLLLAR
jgi:hypothetical protein